MSLKSLCYAEKKGDYSIEQVPGKRRIVGLIFSGERREAEADENRWMSVSCETEHRDGGGQRGRREPDYSVI